MRTTRPLSERIRATVWLVGTIAALGLYAVAAGRSPVHTPVGVETPLFSCSDINVDLIQPGAGSRAFLAVSPADWVSPPPQRRSWPPDYGSPRLIETGRPSGTWETAGTSLRQVWHIPAEASWGTHYLVAFHPFSPYAENQILDLNTGQTLPESQVSGAEHQVGRTLRSHGGRLDNDQRTYPEWLPRSPFDNQFGTHFTSLNIDGSLLFLYASVGPKGSLYAVPSSVRPRFLPLVTGARLVGVTRDGRTVFFQRDAWLWRLDLRKTLPQLLDEGPLLTPEQLREQDRIER